MPKAQAFDAALQYLRSKVPQLGMFSTLDELIHAAPQEKMSAQQWQQYLQPGRTLTREGINFPLKQEELQYSGLPTYLSQTGYTGPLTKKNVLDFLQQNRPEFNLTKGVQNAGTRQGRLPEIGAGQGQRSYPVVQSAQYPEHAHEAGVPGSYEENITTSPDFGSFPSHFSPQDLSWSRTTRHPVADDPQGRLARLVEEIQSDRHEAAAERLYPEASREQEALQPLQRRGYRTPEEESLSKNFANQDLPPDAPNRVAAVSLYRKPPDTPFKDPADYAGLELRKQLLNSVNQGDSYLALTRGADQVQRYEQGMGGGKGEGMSYIYDQVYPSALKKLARQYGADVSDIPVNVKGGAGDIRPPYMVMLEAENPSHFIESVAENEPENIGSHVQRLINEMKGPLEGNDEAFNHLMNARDAANDLESTFKDSADLSGKALSRNELEQGKHRDKLEQSLNAAYDHWRNLSGSASAVQKTFPAMNITPEVAERVKKAGVPLFTLAGATALGLGNDDANATPVEDQAMQNANGYGDGGKVTQRLAALAKLMADDVVKNVPTPGKRLPRPPAQLAQELRAGFVDPQDFNHLLHTDPETTDLIGHYQGAVDKAAFNRQPVDPAQKQALIAKLESLGTTTPSQIQSYPTSMTPQNVDTMLSANPPLGKAAGGSVDLVRSALARLGINPPSISEPQEFAEGGATTEHKDNPEADPDSSLTKIAEFLNRYGGPHAARLGTGIAKQFYGTDKNGRLVLGGRAYTDSQGGTPAGILDSFASLPASVIPIANAISGGKESGPEIPTPQWSSDAAARLAALDRKVAASTGIGEAQTLPEHLEDAAAMLATPFPASKVAKEAPALQRMLEMLTPLRPPTLARYGTDSAMLGGANAGLQALTNKLAGKAPIPDNSGAGADPAFAAAALQATNDTGNDDTRDIHNTHRMIPMTDSSGHSYYGIDPATFAGGGKIIDDISKLAMSRRDMLKNLAAAVGVTAIPAGMKALKTDAPKAAEQAAGRGNR